MSAINRLINPIAKIYQARVLQRLNQFGLKYEDAFNEADPDVAVALSRLPADVAEGRARRIKRALDISFKKKPLPMEVQNTLKPMESYLQHLIDEAEAVRLDRELYEGPRNW
eukprot:313180_1